MRKSIRKISIIKDYVKFAEGSCLFQMGDTKVLCVATVTENSVPKFCEEKNIGWITAEYSMLPRAGKQRTNRGQILSSGRTKEINRLIGRALRAVVDLEKLGKRTITIDCDVLQADGGTRTTSINGAYIALYGVLKKLYQQKKIEVFPVKGFLGAVSVGIVDNKQILDLNAAQDNTADVDMNVVMTDKDEFIEIQATAEKNSFSQKQLQQLLLLAEKGIKQIIEKIKKVTK